MFKLKPGEKAESIVRRHWLLFAVKVVEFAFFIVAGTAVFFGSQWYFSFSEEGSKAALFLLTFFYLIIWQGFFIAFIDYYLDTWIITDHRIVDIHQRGLFHRDTSELRLSNIQDVTVRVSGFIATIFDFGDVIVQTAATSQEFKFIQVAHPSKVKDRILHLYDQFKAEHRGDTEVHDNINAFS